MFRSLLLIILTLVLGAVSVSGRPAEFMAQSGQYYVKNEWKYFEGNTPILQFIVRKPDAFSNGLNSDIIDALTTARSKFGRFRRDDKAYDFFLVYAVCQNEQIYWGKAKFSGSWQLISDFDFGPALSELSKIPESTEGLKLLGNKLASQKKVTRATLPTYERAVQKRALEISARVLADLEAKLRGIKITQNGIWEMDSLADKLSSAVSDIGVPTREQIGAVKNKVITAGLAAEVADMKGHLATLHPSRWDEILLIDEEIDQLRSLLVKNDQRDLNSALHEALNAAANALLGMPEYEKQFSTEIAELPASRESLDELSETAQVLEAKSPEYGSLKKYVEKLQIRMGEMLVEYSDQTIEALGKAGASVDDIPALLAECDDEAEWLKSWDAGDMAAVVRLAAMARAVEIADGGYDAYVASLSKLSPNETTLKKLRERHEFLMAYRADVPQLGKYVDAVKSRIDEVGYELSAPIYKKLGIAKKIRNTDINIAGHIVSLADFATRIQAHGHTVTGIKTRPHYGSESASVLGLLGWGTPDESLGEIAIRTKDGVEIHLAMSSDGAQRSDFVPALIRRQKQEEELYSQEWVMLALDLGAVVPTGNADENGITDSDRFASDPADRQKLVPDGILADELNLEVAIEASAAAAEKYPDEPRYKFHLGRALLAGGIKDEAIQYLLSASDNGYSAADALLGPALLEQAISGDKFSMASLRAAEEHFRRAVAGGYPDAKQGLESTGKMLAAMEPPFGEFDFDQRGWIKEVYRDRLDRFSGYNQTQQESIKLYMLGVVSSILTKSESARNSPLRDEIYQYVPTYIKNIAETGTFATEEDIKQSFIHGLRNGIFGQMSNMGGTPADGEDSGLVLMMYLEDESELTRFLQNVLSYLQKYHKKTS